MWPCPAVGTDGTVWLVGGFAPTDYNDTDGVQFRYSANHADLWYSKDAVNWKQLKADTGSGLPDDGQMEPRHAPTCFVTGEVGAQSSLVVLLGTGGSDPNGANGETLSSVRTLSLPAAESLP
jgi:hypothetical protein